MSIESKESEESTMPEVAVVKKTAKGKPKTKKPESEAGVETEKEENPAKRVKQEHVVVKASPKKKVPLDQLRMTITMGEKYMIAIDDYMSANEDFKSSQALSVKNARNNFAPIKEKPKPVATAEDKPKAEEKPKLIIGPIRGVPFPYTARVDHAITSEIVSMTKSFMTSAEVHDEKLSFLFLKQMDAFKQRLCVDHK